MTSTRFKVRLDENVTVFDAGRLVLKTMALRNLQFFSLYTLLHVCHLNKFL